MFCFIASFHLFVQVKSYARFNDQRNEYDKGYVSIAYSLYIEGSYYNEPDTTARHLYCLSLMLTFTFLKLIFLFQLLLQNQCSCIIPKYKPNCLLETSWDACTGQQLSWLSSGILCTLLFQCGTASF